jgi:hypothetical protein
MPWLIFKSFSRLFKTDILPVFNDKVYIMKFIRYFCVALLMMCSFPSLSYVIYNQTNHSVHVKDVVGFGGLEASIPPHASVACDPNAAGCYGRLSFRVYSNMGSRDTLCQWSGKISGLGNYFVIRDTSTPCPRLGSCQMDFYKND